MEVGLTQAKSSKFLFFCTPYDMPFITEDEKTRYGTKGFHGNFSATERITESIMRDPICITKNEKFIFFKKQIEVGSDIGMIIG
eukprot:8932248-Ditylum_brightwellii.AAC.1